MTHSYEKKKNSFILLRLLFALDRHPQELKLFLYPSCLGDFNNLVFNLLLLTRGVLIENSFKNCVLVSYCNILLPPESDLWSLSTVHFKAAVIKQSELSSQRRLDMLTNNKI